MKPEDFQYLSRLLKERSGLIVNDQKVYLLESRLTPIARQNNLADLSELVAEMKKPGKDGLIKDVTEAMTTNESFFFRDNTPFDSLKAVVLPAMKQSRAVNKGLKIWCAAASSGQEPYSISMILKENEAQWAGWRHSLVATDICTKILAKAKEGLYSQFEVQRGLPIQLMMKYFTQEGDMWRISQDIRQMVNYQYLNLLDNFDTLGVFDIVYCRNVLIYFDQETKSKVLAKIRKRMHSDSILYLGAAETVLGISDEFKPVKGQRGMYMPSDGDPTPYEGT